MLNVQALSESLPRDPNPIYTNFSERGINLVVRPRFRVQPWSSSSNMQNTNLSSS